MRSRLPRQYAWQDSQSTSGWADLIELDIRSAGATQNVAHDNVDNLNCARLSDVLMDRNSARGDQILCVEIKERHPTAAHIRQLMDLVKTAEVARPKRPFVFRAFDDRRKNLTLIQAALKQPEFRSRAASVRLHVLLRSMGATQSIQNRILRKTQTGFDGIEFR